MTKKKERGMSCLAFFLPVVLMMVLFIINSIYPFGDRSFLSGDLWHQYMPFFSELLHKIKGQESFDFSYQLGIGSNFLANYVYYLASPFNFLALLLPEKHLIDFIGYMIVFKTGLCGLTAHLYLKEHFGVKDYSTVLFSLFYAFSGFLAAYDYNIMWVDCVWLLPLILLGLERLVKEGRYGLYCVSLACSIYTNYYLSIMICIFLVLYFVVLFVLNKPKRLRSIGLFAVFSLLAGAMASVLLIPEVCAILQTDFGDMDFPTKVESYFSVLDMLARHLACVSTEKGLDHWPNIFCGSAVLMMIPLYLMNRKISIREKFLRMGLAGFLLLSFSTNILDFVWHGLNYPDSLPARQSFLYIFGVLIMCYDAYHHLKETDEQQILYGYLAAVVFILFCEKFIDHEDFRLGVRLVSFLFVTLYAVVLYLYRTKKSRFAKAGVTLFAAILILTECGVNMGVTSIPTTSRSAYLGQQADYKALYEKTLEREEGFCRIEKFTRKTKNDGTLTGYPTASTFSSTLNSQVMDLYTRLGMLHSKVYYGFDGATAFTSALLNVGYMFGESDKYENSLFTHLEQSGDIHLYECNYRLPFGYVAPVGYDLPEGFQNQAFQLQNKMAEELGIQGKLFTKEYKGSSAETITFKAAKDGIYYGVVSASGTKKILVTNEQDEKTEYKDLKINCILYLGHLKQGETITLKNGDDADKTPKIAVDFYSMNETILQQTLELLSGTHLENVKVTSNTIAGNLTLEEAGRLILSVPYEDGWTVWMNGEKVEGELFGGCLMAFDLEPGTYDISMKYRAKGADAGILVSLAGMALFAVILFADRRKHGRLRHSKEEQTEDRVSESEEEKR